MRLKTYSSCLFITLFLIAGCATIPNKIDPAELNRSDKLAIITKLTQNELQVIDRTGLSERNATGNQFGLLGALIESAITENIKAKAIKSSLGGEPDNLRALNLSTDIEEKFNKAIIKTISSGFDVAGPEQTSALVDNLPKKKSINNVDIKDYSVLYDKIGSGKVLEIEYVYGIAAFNGSYSSAAISANILFIDIKSNKVLMRKKLFSDTKHKKGFTVKEFEMDSASLYKKEIDSAIDAMSSLIANEFGLQQKEQSYWAE